MIVTFAQSFWLGSKCSLIICQTDTLIHLEVIRLNVEIFYVFHVRPEVTNVLVTRGNTVKPLNSEHLWVLKNLSAIERCLLLGGNFKKIYPFGTKCFVRYLWHVRYLDVRYWDISLYITSETYLFTKNESSISKHNVKEFYNSPLILLEREEIEQKL